MAGSFSFDTPEEVMHVLASIRASNISAAEKSQLRDLVLSYTNGGKDPSLKIQLEQQLTQLGVAPNAKQSTLTATDQPEFGSSRGVPSFTVAALATPPPSPQPVAPPPSAASVPSPAQAAPASAPKTVAAEPVASMPVAPPPAATTPAPAVAPTPTGESVPASATPEVQSAPPSPSASGAVDPLQRIREIKALVNQKVGNPVNLVDIDNQVGREYMAALLDAMKKVSAGGDASSAMARLETAYSAVETVLRSQGGAPSDRSTPEPVNLPTGPVPEPAMANQSVEPSGPESDDESTKIPIKTSRPFSPVPAAETSTDDSATRWANNNIRFADSVVPAGPSAAQVTPSATSSESPTTTPVPEPPPAEPAQPKSSASPKQTPPEPPAPTPKTPVVPASKSATLQPLSKTGEPLKTVNDLPASDSLETAKDGDPLFTKEVDDGLNQLLVDWSLFKKSGLFGTGPKGIEHPLFQKIKHLEIPILLAGRFEGSTQEVKQSITDYMNGWRYEQGIIYEQGETFEHYLRRVIRHILDLQK